MCGGGRLVLCLHRAWVSVAAAKCGLGREDKGTRVEAPCVGDKRGLGLCWSRVILGLVLVILRCCLVSCFTTHLGGGVAVVGVCAPLGFVFVLR